MSASDDQMDPSAKDWSMMDDHAYISTVEDEESATMDTAPAEDFSEVASCEATTDDDAEPCEITKPSTPTPERIEDIILGKKIPKELKSILELSKEAKIDVNMVHKRKSINDSENSGSSERSETPDRSKNKRLNKLSPPIEGDSLLDDVKTESPHTTRMLGTKDKVAWKRRVEGSVGGATTSVDHKIVKRMPMPPRNSTNVRNHKDCFCWQCHRIGVNVSCETCPRSYHTKCVKTPVIDPDHWPCPECIAILTAENVKTRSVAMKDVSLEQLCDLLKFAHRRMVQIADTDPFMNPVNEAEFPDYYSYIVQPMDLSTLQRNIKENTYGSTIAFEADSKWILHNSIIFNTYQSKLTSTAKTIVRICKHEMSEIENCYTCYLNANTMKNWFVEVCPKPHPVIWAKLKGFPYWPAKAMCTNNVGMVDCRFFGAHDRAWVSYKDCYLFCQQDPNSNKQKRLDIIECIKEVDVYIENLCKSYGEFNYAPFKTLYDPENEVKQLQILLPKLNADEPSTKTVPKIKIVAKKTSETEPATFKVKDPKKNLKSEETFSESEEEEESESEETSEEEEEALSSSDEEENQNNVRNKRNAIIDDEDDSDFSESEEIKIIERMRTRRRGPRRTSNVSNRSLESPVTSERSGQNSDQAEEVKPVENDVDESSKTSDKDAENNTSKMSDMLMKKLNESNEMDEESTDYKEAVLPTDDQSKKDEIDTMKTDSIEEKKHEEMETSLDSSEPEDVSDKEIPHITGDMDVDDYVEDDDEDDDDDDEDDEDDEDDDDADGDKADENAHIITDTSKDLESKHKEQNKDTDSSEADDLENECTKDIEGSSTTDTQTKEAVPSEEIIQDSTPSVDKEPTEENCINKEQVKSGQDDCSADKSISSDKTVEPELKRSGKESKVDNPIPELIKLSNLVESTGLKRKKSSDSSSNESDGMHQSKKLAKEDDNRENNSPSNGYESIQSILKRQGKVKASTPQPQSIKQINSSNIEDQSAKPAYDKRTTKDTQSNSDKIIAAATKRIEPKSKSFSTDILTITTVNDLAEIKSEPVSPDFSSSSSDEEDDYTDNGYMMAKLQYLSALNISEKRPMDKNKDKKQKEIRTRSKTEELTKGRMVENDGMLRNIASYLENAGDEITIHKKRHPHSMPTITTDNSANVIKVLQNNSSVTIKQRARKSFPKPTLQQHPGLVQMVTKGSLSHTDVLPLSKIDTLAKAANVSNVSLSATAIIAKGNAAAAAVAAGKGDGRRSVSILNTSVSGGVTAGQIVVNPTKVGGVASTVATTTTSNLMILTHPQAGSVVLPAGSTLPQSLTPYLSSYYYVTPSTQVIAATTTTAATNVTATAIPPLSAIQSLQLVQSQQPISAISSSGTDVTDKYTTFDLTLSPSQRTITPSVTTTTSISATALNAVVGNDSSMAESTTIYDPSILNGLVPENITRAVADLFCKRAPPKLKPRPPGALSSQFESGVGSEAGPLAARINSVAHRFTDYFRGMLVETLADLSTTNPEAVIAALRLDNETMKQKHAEEMLEIKKNVNTLMGDIQKSVTEEKDKIIEETKAKCEQETIRRVNETKSKQWCANCMKEAQFYCCWNTSYCDYPCQAKHWLKHQYKCTQEMNNQTQGHGSTSGGGSGGNKQSHAGQPIVLRHSAPPPKGFTGKIMKATGKVIMNSRGNAKIPMNVLRRASNGSGHITIIESTPGNYELVGNGPITLGPANTKNSSQGMMKVKSTGGVGGGSSVGGGSKQQQNLTSNLPPNSKAILMSKNSASPITTSLMKSNSSSGQKQVLNKQSINTRSGVDGANTGSAGGNNRT